jgi:LPXTG-motif cell wall-anchored protein
MASNLQAVKLAPAHTLVAVEAKAPTCTEFGNIAYWYCSACDWVEVEGGMASNLQAVKLAPAHNLVKVEAKAATCFEMGNIEYWYCTNCDWVEVAGGMASNRLAVLLPVSHNIVHVEAKAPTATENGNIEYWYCTNCGYAWLDELCTKNTNLKAVILPATGETPVDPENPGSGDNAIAFVLLGVLMLGATGVVIGKKKRFSVK